MELLHSLTPVLLIVSILFLWIGMLLHAVMNKIPNKTLWILVVLLGSVIGSVIYYITVYRKYEPEPGKGLLNKRLAINIAIATIVAGGVLSVNASLRPVPAVKDISFEQAITLANSGEIERIDISGDNLRMTRSGEKNPSLQTRKQPGSSIYQQGLTNRNVTVSVRSPKL